MERSDRYDSREVRATNRRLDLRGQRARFREATEKLTQVDLVITWLNSTDATWRDAVKRFKPSDPDGSPLFNPNGDGLSDTFMELKYSLRSYEQHGLLARTRRVFLVHSDLYPPPHYLNFAHPQLTAMPHSAFFPRNSSLPTFNRNAIGANIHRIPNLQPWYLVLDDDFLLARPFSWSTFIRASTLVARFASIKRLRDIGATSLRDGYFGAMGNSARLLARQFGNRARGADLHFPYFVWRPAMDELARGWPQVFAITSASRFGSAADIQAYVLYGHYMVDTGRSRELSGWWDGLRGRGATWDEALAELHTTDECRCDGHTRDLSSDALTRVNPNPIPNPILNPNCTNSDPDPNPRSITLDLTLTLTLTLTLP